MQRSYIINNSHLIEYSIPDANEEILPGIIWGHVFAFPSPAYWVHQLKTRNITNNKINYKLGDTFLEEVGACLLGGHGIPAEVGLAAYNYLKEHEIFSGQTVVSLNHIYELLSTPLNIKGKQVKYRFAKQKSAYLHKTLKILTEIPMPYTTERRIRNWLTHCPGIGYKTASWIVRNWFDSDDVAILDIHILRAGVLGGFLDKNLKVEKDYLKIEQQYIDFCKAIKVRPAELDALIWYEMMLSKKTVRRIFSESELAGSNNSHAYAS